jgi:hypothetical protein
MKTGIVNYMIGYGVDDSHINECLKTGEGDGHFGLFYKRKNAIKAFQGFEPEYPFKIVQLVRLEFGDEYCAASSRQILKEKRLNTKEMIWNTK